MSRSFLSFSLFLFPLLFRLFRLRYGNILTGVIEKWLLVQFVIKIFIEKITIFINQVSLFVNYSNLESYTILVILPCQNLTRCDYNLRWGEGLVG